MRLLTTDGEGNLTGEIKTFDPISGIYDAVKVANAQGGDGTYWVDTGNNKYYEFKVADGQPVGLTEDGWREGNPADVVDDVDLAERTSNPASSFGGFFLDDEAKAAAVAARPEDAPDTEAREPAPEAPNAVEAGPEPAGDV